MSNLSARDAAPASPVPDLDESLPHLQALPQTLDFHGEFGTELMLFLPYCAWLSKAGLLRSRRIRTFRGMRPFYDDFDCLEIIEKDTKRSFIDINARPAWWPVKNYVEFSATGRSPFHFYPDWRAKFRKRMKLNQIGAFKKPILVVHNKHNNEWSRGPVNAISLPTLDAIFSALKDKFSVVYIRHGLRGTQAEGFSEDHNEALPFADAEVVDRHPEVFCFDTMFKAYREQGGIEELNAFKSALYAHTHHFISSQGGGASQMAMFNGALISVLHREGREAADAYNTGYYSFTARVPPLMAISRNEDDLLRSLALFEGTVVLEDRLHLDPANLPVLQALSARTISKR